MNQDNRAAERLFTGKSEMAMQMQSLDWSQTSLGAIETWSQSLRSTLSICLNSRFPIAIYWGSDFTLLYNDAWRPIIGDKHPWALGRPGQEAWSEIWDAIGPELAGVVATGEGTFHNDELLAMQRFGYTEECFFEYTFNPIQGQSGEVEGVFNVVTETTYRVLNDRRARLLREVASRTGTAQTMNDTCAAMMQALRSDPADIPAAFLYLIDSDGKYARLYRDTALDPGICPEIVDLAEIDNDPWSIALAAHTAQPKVIAQLPYSGEFPNNPWSEPPQEAMVLPIAATGQSKMSGVLVAIASPRRRLDESYCNFFTQLAGQIAMGIANARIYEEERKRAEALAELDRAKTVFFSNVSHEFRTPLTLMLAPTEDALSDPDEPLSNNQRERIETVQRNGLRLLKLVNTLLDFSRIEAGRVEAAYEAIDLAAFTAELASVFRSTIERAGLRLSVDCPPLPEAVYVDREMWEKVVFNLLSNAFKFTFAGEIAVCLQWQNDHVALMVRDTGIGIPAAELPNLFERFHRVKGAQGRSFEGSGIGLSLVQELVKLHGGAISVTSVEGEGTCFTVSIPTGTAHLPPERISATRTLTSTALGANAYLEEALRWLPTENTRPSDSSAEFNSELLVQSSSFKLPNTRSARILVVDDNADMRDYVERLLSQQYEVRAVADGVAALSAVRHSVPDLVLTDVMMPNLDGFGLLQAMRTNPQTREVPVIMLSARAGEEARIEGLSAGADDYLVKPFSARELLARVEATLKLAQLRREATQREQALRLEAEAVSAKLESVLAGINEQFIVLDHQWRYTFINEQVTVVTGKTQEELLGQCVWEVFPDVIGTPFEVAVRRAVAEKTFVQVELFYSRYQRWLESRIYPFAEGVTIFVSDISDRKRVEEALRESEKFLKGINETAPNLLYIFDLNERRNLYVSPQIFPMLGVSSADVQAIDSQLFAQLFHPDDLERIEQHHDKIRAAQEDDIFTIEYRMRHSSGKWLWLSSRDTIFVRDEQGKPMQMLGSAIDITDRKQAELEREQLLAQEQAAREEAQAANRIKDEFLAVLSHELRSPLNPILGWAKLLKTGNLDAAKTAQAINTIERNAKLQSELIEDLLDVSRILQGKLSLNVNPIHLASTIRSAIETVRLAAEAKSITLEVDLDSSVGQVSGDSTRLQQVVWNLLSNAVKFTPTAGQVTVRLEQVDDQAQITVSDTGKGISADFLPHVFDYFRQEDGATTRKFGGLGLGLAIVRHLVELHGGTVQAESQGEGLGATFRVSFPLIPTQPTFDRDRAAELLLNLNGVQVLVIDDEIDSREFVAFVLEQAGANVTTATTASEGFLALTQSPPDVLLSDIGMPDMDGYMLMQQVRALPPEQGGQVRAIALTAYAGEINYQQALQAGFQQHLAKPIEPERLVKAIATLMREVD